MAGIDRDKALAAAMAQIEKAHGKGAIMRLGDTPYVPMEVIPTGAISLDVALGIGGYPRGRVVEIYGPESSGKTSLALHAVASAQAAGGIAGFIDAEHALDPAYARKLSASKTDESARVPTGLPASRRSRSRTCSCAPARWTSS